MKYYVRIGSETRVMTAEEIFPLIKQGTITPQTKACAVGATAWSELGQLLPALFVPGAEPPSEGGAMEMVGKAGQFLAEHGGEVASLAKVFTRRIFASNFVAEHALPEERALLEKAAVPVRSPMAQNFVAWRRAILWVAGIGLAIAGFIAFIIDFSAMFGPGIPPALRFISIGTQVLNFLAPVLIIHAALRWTDVRRSRKIAKLGWLCQFLGPIILLLLPVKEMTTTGELAKYFAEFEWKAQQMNMEKEIEKATDATVRKDLQKKMDDAEKDFRTTKVAGEVTQLTQVFDEGKKQLEDLRKNKKAVKFTDLATLTGNREAGAYIGGTAVLAGSMTLMALMTLLPRIFGMFPGIVRASLTLRTLVPESPLPGYVAALIEPLYCLLVLIFVVISSQLGQWMFFDGLLCLLGSAYFLISNARRLSKPVDSAAMNAHLKPLRHKMLLCTATGLVFIVVAISDYISDIGFWRITSILCHLLGNIVLLTAVAADFLLGLMKFSFDQDQGMRGTPLQADLENRFADLAQARLAQISDDLPPALEPVPPAPAPTPSSAPAPAPTPEQPVAK